MIRCRLKPCNKIKDQRGFTLIEVAVVLVIVGLIVGSFIGSFSSRIETSRRDTTQNQLQEIKAALLGFVSAEGRLPCPTTTTGNGNEEPIGGSTIATPCTLQHGFIPGKTLGIQGAYNRDNLLIDVWGNPIRYSVVKVNSNAFTNAAGAGGIKDVGIANLFPNLVICASASDLPHVCDADVATLINNAAYVVLSLGKDGSDFVTNLAPDTDQGENAGEVAVIKNPAGENQAYTVAGGRAFVSKSYSDADSVAGAFDDLIVWESPYIIYSRMLEAGQLP